MMTTETEVDKNFLIRTFFCHCFSVPCRYEGNADGGGIIIFEKDIHLNILAVELNVELNLHKIK